MNRQAAAPGRGGEEAQGLDAAPDVEEAGEADDEVGRKRAEEAERKRKVQMFLQQPAIMDDIALLYLSLEPERLLMEKLLQQSGMQWDLDQLQACLGGGQPFSSRTQELHRSDGPLYQMLLQRCDILTGQRARALGCVLSTELAATKLFVNVLRCAALVCL